LILDLATGDIDHELGELGGVARRFGRLSDMAPIVISVHDTA
jgi:hypothetical protein